MKKTVKICKSHFVSGLSRSEPVSACDWWYWYDWSWRCLEIGGDEVFCHPRGLGSSFGPWSIHKNNGLGQRQGFRLSQPSSSTSITSRQVILVILVSRKTRIDSRPIKIDFPASTWMFATGWMVSGWLEARFSTKSCDRPWTVSRLPQPYQNLIFKKLKINSSCSCRYSNIFI